MKRKVLITGGSGFIGSHLKEHLENSDFEIKSIGRNKNEDFKIDLVDSSLTALIKKLSPEIIGHFASGSNIVLAEKEKEKEYQDTVLATKNLINSSSKDTTLIYLSSQAVYGLPESLPVSETHSTNPISIYGKNKLEAERIISQSGLNYVIFRISSIYGPGQDFKKSGVISKFINWMKNNESPVIFNSPEMFSDFIYINDVINAIKLSIQKIKDKNVKNQIFNLSSEKATSLKEVLDVLYKFYPSAPKPKLEINSSYPYGKYKGLYLNTNKAKSALSWSCKYNIEEGLKEMLENMVTA